MKHHKKILSQRKKRYQKHREKEIALKKIYYQKHRERILARSKAYYLKHCEKIKEKRKTYYVEHKMERIAYTVKWQRNNPQKVRERTKRFYSSDKGRISDRNEKHKRRIRKGKGSGITNQQWNELLRKHNFRCAYCGIKDNMTIDHVVPLSKGGKHSIENIVPACAKCNSRKHTSLDWKPQIYKKVIGE